MNRREFLGCAAALVATPAAAQAAGDFGAFVEVLPGKEGLVHVSEMKEERVEKPSDVVKEGDKVTVKLLAVDDRGRLQLSMKAAARELDKKN